MPAPVRSDLLKALDTMLRKVGAQSVLISDLVATRVGLNSTDLECLDLLYMAGSTTAGRLAAHTGLTTGATTAVIDRLEQAGFVRRRRDAVDRRLVLVEVVPSSAERILPLYAPLSSDMARLNERYGNHQLAVVLDYMSQALDAGAQHVAWLQRQPRVRRRTPRGRQVPRRRPTARGRAAARDASA